MSSVIDSFINFFSTILTFLTNIVNGLVQIIQTIPAVMAFVGNALDCFPSVLITFALLFVTTSVVYLIIGR